MRKLIMIWLLIIPLLGWGQNAGVNTQSAAPVAADKAVLDLSPANQEMETTFKAKSLKHSQVTTFQDRSIQKLKDFYNYITIISNPKYDKRLRENAKAQAKQLFYGTDCKVDGKPAADFIDSCSNSTIIIEAKAEEIIVSKDMTPEEGDTAINIYRGELSFKESVNNVVSGRKRAEIVLSKSEKQFGESKQEVWMVFICSIE